MRLIENELYLTFGEMVDCGVSENTLKHAKSRGVNCWKFIDDPADNRKVLIAYEALKDMYKKLVLERYGDPYLLVARQPILELVINDPLANLHYKNYRYDGSKRLTLDAINDYTRAASWLNMLSEYGEDYKFIRKTLGLSIPEFYSSVSELVKQEIANGASKTYSGLNRLSGKFPTSYGRIRERVKRYNEEGYDSVISPMYGNKIAAKVGKTEDGFDEQRHREQIAVIRTAAGLHVNWDSEQVTRAANEIFRQNGWPEISSSTVYNIMQENKALLTPARHGKRTYDSTISMQVKRSRPEFPTYYWTLDGWTVELLFQERTAKGMTYHNRLVVVVVLDAMNNYPVGYAIGERETPELIREANRNAILHMKALFGDHYSPYQLQSDRYALKNLTPFYQAMAQMHIPAAVGNAKAKVIEPYFKHLNKNYCQMQANWSGFNVTSRKETQVNSEKLDMIKHQFPEREGVVLQIEQMMERERRAKVEEYMQQWEVMPGEHKQVMSLMDRLEVFGIAIGGSNSISDKGIIKMIDGQQVTFDCFEQGFREHLHINWTIKCEPEDLSHALAISPDGKVKFVLEQKMVLPMSVRETKQEHTDYRKRVTDYNNTAKQNIINTYSEDAQIMEEVLNRNPLELTDGNEAALKLMFTNNRGQQKDGIQDAKQLNTTERQKRIEQPVNNEWETQRQKWLEDQTDLEGYENL